MPEPSSISQSKTTPAISLESSRPRQSERTTAFNFLAASDVPPTIFVLFQENETSANAAPARIKPAAAAATIFFIIKNPPIFSGNLNQRFFLIGFLCFFTFFGGLDFFAECLIFCGYVFYIFWFFFCGSVFELCYYIL